MQRKLSAVTMLFLPLFAWASSGCGKTSSQAACEAFFEHANGLSCQTGTFDVDLRCSASESCAGAVELFECFVANVECEENGQGTLPASACATELQLTTSQEGCDQILLVPTEELCDRFNSDDVLCP